MNLYDMMMKRRSVRVFNDQEIPESIIEQLLDVANQAPTGGNIQPLSIILVRSLEGRKKLAQLVRDQPWVRNALLSMIFCLDFYRSRSGLRCARPILEEKRSSITSSSLMLI